MSNTLDVLLRAEVPEPQTKLFKHKRLSKLCGEDVVFTLRELGFSRVCLLYTSEPYRRLLMVLGKRVRFYREGAWQSGRAVGLDSDGCLEVETPSGTVLLRAGEIRMEGEPT